MNKNRKTAIVVGILFLIALFTNLIAENIRGDNSLILHIIVLDLLSAIGVIGIGIFMYPILKQLNKKLALTYAFLRILEGILFFIMIISLLLTIDSFVNLNSIYVYIFVLCGLIFYSSLYKLKLIPNYLSIWGIIAIIMLLIANVLGLLSGDSTLMILLASPIALNEFVLAIWLIIKGFNKEVLK